MPLRFTAKMLIRGVNPYVPVSAAQAASLKPGWRKPLPVLVRVNGKPKTPWRINMMPTGKGGFYLYLHGDVRKASATQVGDRITLELRFDPAYRNGPMHPMPAWFAAALAQNSNAKKSWTLLTPSRQKEILRYFARLKSKEAKARNLSRALRILSGESARFMARSWKDGK